MTEKVMPKRTISKQESEAISVIRVAAMVMIVLCHYTQAIGYSVLGQVFNVGVPIFFIISGFLYGQKTIGSDECFKWYYKQIIKLVIPIYVYYLITAIILLCMNELGNVSFGKVILQLMNLQGLFYAGIGNIEVGPLWFITYILLCYFITPRLQKLRDSISVKGTVVMIVILYVIENIVIMLIKPFGFIVNVTGVITYIMAYYVGAYWNKKVNAKWHVLLTVIMIAATVFRFVFKSYADNIGGIYIMLYERVVVGYTHLALAWWIFFTLYGLCDVLHLVIDKIYSIVKYIDKQSYYIYIVHYAFLAGKLERGLKIYQTIS